MEQLYSSGFSVSDYMDEFFIMPPQSPDSSNNNSPVQITPQLSDVSQSSTGSPPQSIPHFHNTSSSKPPNKRKRQTVIPEQSQSVHWEKYDSPSVQCAALYEDLSPMNGTFSMGVRHIDKNIQPSPEGKSWIVYRQNQFKLQCYLTGSLQHYTTPVVSVEDIPHSRSPTTLFVRSENNVYPVEGLYFYLYAIKQHEDEEHIVEESKIALHQVGPSRTKKETRAPDLLPIVDGEAMFDKLQFQASTSVGGHAYFRVITRLVCKSAEGIRVVTSQISPRMVVRAQNPGRYATPKQIGNIPNTAVHTNFTNPTTPLSNPHSLLPPSLSGMNASLSGMTSSMVLSPPSLPAMTSSASVGSGEMMHSGPVPKLMNIGNPPMPMMSPFGMLPHLFNSTSSYNQPENSSKSPWLMTREVVYHHGKVGINTNSPPEALSVQGNILVTGDILKPSDRRLKRNFMLVDTSSQMTAIENIKIYDYEVMAEDSVRKERGVIAQELEKVMPEAVHHLGDVAVSGQNIENLLVVNERMLLLENIGATQHLDKAVKREKEEIEFVNNKVKELEEEENKNSSALMRAMHSMLGLIMSEDFRESSEDECLYCGVSLLGLGPAWTLFVMGWFFPPAWVLGTLYAFSKSRSKRTAGVINMLMILMITCVVLIITNSGKGSFYVACIIGVVVIGLVLITTISFFKKKRQRLRASVWKRLRVLMREAREEEAKKAYASRKNSGFEGDHQPPLPHGGGVSSSPV